MLSNCLAKSEGLKCHHYNSALPYKGCVSYEDLLLVLLFHPRQSWGLKHSVPLLWIRRLLIIIYAKKFKTENRTTTVRLSERGREERKKNKEGKWDYDNNSRCELVKSNFSKGLSFSNFGTNFWQWLNSIFRIFTKIKSEFNLALKVSPPCLWPQRWCYRH